MAKSCCLPLQIAPNVCHNPDYCEKVYFGELVLSCNHIISQNKLKIKDKIGVVDLANYYFHFALDDQGSR